ncbi:pyroglutamyl-peptidase I [Roseateles chitinivorans]|uniref:pyroglutamyl-peptidase I n=1 Tax=Roseateles chitinivorans TaxID=2917965 RepID=UPI003D6719AB
MTTILLTGIDPFNGETINPSWEAVRALDGETVGSARLVARQLPCVIGEVGGALIAAIEEVNPDLVLCLGQAGGRPDVTIERVAINIVDARIPDNAGLQPVDEPVVAGGPAAYFSTLPIKALVAALHGAGIPASVSESAGTYNCNAIFYALSHHIATRRPGLRGGFIHVPFLPEQAVRHRGAPSMTREMLSEAVRVMVATALTTTQDVKLGFGSEH